MTDDHQRRIAPGVYRTPTGFRAFVRVRLAPGRYELKTKRFPKSEALKAIKDWRHQQHIDARDATSPTPIKGTLAEDIRRYLIQVAAMPTLEWRRRDLEAWRECYGDVERRAITTGMIRGTLHRWRTEGPVVRFDPKTRTKRLLTLPLSASACNHRRTALLHLYATLDGKDGPNPVRAVKPFREPPPAPRGKDMGLLIAALRRIRNTKTRARARVLLWTGIRGNSELAKMTPTHVDLRQRICHVPTGKGGATMRTVPLSRQAAACWKVFMLANAWGPYDKDVLRKSIRAAVTREAKARGLTVPSMRAYDLRHSLASALRGAGADLADIADVLGHTSLRMTKRYAPFQVEKLRKAMDRIA